jgi:hypothetical protein
MRRPLRIPALLALIPAFAFAAPIHAQVLLLNDGRRVSALAEYAGLTDAQVIFPAAPFAYWPPQATVHIDNPDPDPNSAGSCDAAAFQISQVVGSGFSASGGCGGSWQILELGPHYVAESQAEFDFRLPQTMAYTLDAWLESGQGTTSEGWCWLAHYAPNLVVQQCPLGGELHIQGRLASGDYQIDGWSKIDSSDPSASGPTYTYLLTFSPVGSPLIVDPPQDASAATGATVHFSVTTSVPTNTLTFQWQRNGVPLSNGATVSGANTPTLSLASVAVGDSGWYEVVVSDGTVDEPSRLARLDVTPTSGVPAPGARPGLALELAGPNPFMSSATLRYTVAHTGRVTVAVYDLTGARVRTLLDANVNGPGLVTWDGRTEAGGQAPDGLYFVRLTSPAGVARRTIARMR